MEKATRQQIKEQNRNLVLRLIVEQENTSRAEIARATLLTRTTVSDLVAELIDEGLVEEIGLGSSIGGKSPILLRLVENARYLVGLDLAYNRFSGAVVNLRGQILDKISQPVLDCKGERALQAAYHVLDQLVQRSNRPLAGIGVGAPGLVNSLEGKVINAVNLEWQDLPLQAYLQARYHLPVYVLNDCQAAAMGEVMYGNGHRLLRNMVVIRVGHGIGAGVIIDGQVYHGDGGGAGEIGHVVIVHKDGLPCRCGHYGCLETVASSRAVLQRVQVLAQAGEPTWSGSWLLDRLHAGGLESLDLESLEQAVAQGDALAQHVVIEAGRFLGAAVSALVGALNIQKVVLIGEMARFGDLWLNAVKDTMAQACLSRLAQATTIELGRLKDNDVILGASAMMANNYSLLYRH